MPITINKNSLFDYLYIDDLINVVKWAIHNNPSRKTYNTCSGKVYNYETLAKKVLEVSGKDLSIHIKDKDNIVEYSGNPALLYSEATELQYSRIDDSITKLYGWYESHFEY
jgi:GDP-L-fucose synthase